MNHKPTTSYFSVVAFAAVSALGVYGQSAAHAQSLPRGDRLTVQHRESRSSDNEARERFERERRHHRTKTVYVIEGGRPVQRVLFVDERGRYYREERGQQIFVQERVFESYPSHYFHRD